MTLLAVDPGLNGTGWAAFRAGRLAGCGCVAGGEGGLLERIDRIVWAVRIDSPQGGRLVIEKPQIYRQRKQRGDPNDLIDIAILVGELRRHLGPRASQLVLPREWKGTVPKTRKLGDYIIHKRVLKRLPPAERECYQAGLEAVLVELRHNIADAVGIGLWALGLQTQGAARKV